MFFMLGHAYSSIGLNSTARIDVTGSMCMKAQEQSREAAPAVCIARSTYHGFIRLLAIDEASYGTCDNSMQQTIHLFGTG